MKRNPATQIPDRSLGCWFTIRARHQPVLSASAVRAAATACTTLRVFIFDRLRAHCEGKASQCENSHRDQRDDFSLQHIGPPSLCLWFSERQGSLHKIFMTFQSSGSNLATHQKVVPPQRQSCWSGCPSWPLDIYRLE